MPTPPPPLSPTYTPKIQVTHPHVPDFGSQRHLVDTPPPSPPYHGQDNPAFSFDKDALFHRAPSQVDPISLPHQPESPAFRSLPPLRRGSYSPFLPATDKDSLAVPVLGARRQSLTSSWGRDSGGGGGGGGGGGMSLLPFPHRHPKPPHRLSIENVTSDMRAHATPSPGLLSMWSSSDYMGTPAPRDLETASKHRLSVPREGTASIFSSEADLLYRSSSELLSLPPSRSSSELLSVPRSSFCTSSMSNVSGSLGERMHELVRAFSSRTQRCKERISQPPTPSSTCSEDDKSDVDDGLAQRMHRLGSFLPTVSTSSDVTGDAPRYLKLGPCRMRLPRCCSRLPSLTHTMESYSKMYVSWLFVVMLAYVYNSTVIPLRGVFPYQTKHNWHYWLMADYFFDLIYLTDIIMFKSRLRFTHEGVVETDFKQTKKHYIKKLVFKLDMLSLLPLDIMYLTTDEPWLRKYVWLRLPRMLKVQTFWEFYARCDQAAKSSAHAIRIVKTMMYMLYLIHIETCGYYAVSEYEGLATNRWVYNNKGNAYIRCFYLATKTATSIGNNPKPTNTLEFLFMTLYWLSGVFVFALLIGQIRDIVEAAGQVKTSYRKKMDAVLHYMKSIQISDYTRDRAREWFLYNWEQSKTIDERSLVAALPKKLQTDLAISVHFNTLIKVQLFQDCERNLLYDLVLKLKPNLFLPGDYVCQKGEVGKEMYIVSQGQVQVVGGEKGDVVLATLSEGSVFGEISLLAMSGRGNRRTADVRCSGYTSVFTLSKDDFEEAMNEYPEAQKLLRKRAKKLLKENARKMEKSTTKVEAEEIIKTPHDTPKMVRTVIQVLNPESQTAQKLHVGNKKPPPPPPSTSAGSQHLTVPMSVPKIVKVPSRAQGQAHSNLAFDLSDEQGQMKPSIVTQYYDDDDLMDHDDEIIVIERTEEALPLTNDEDNDLDDILKGDDDDDDDDDNDSNDNFEEPFEDAEEVSSVEQEFFNSVMAELRAQDVVQSDWQSTRPQPQANSVQTNDNSEPQNHNLTPQNESIWQQNDKWRQNGHVTHQNSKKPQNEDNTSGFQDADTETTTESNTSPVPEETAVPSGEVNVSRNETTASGNETAPPQGERNPCKVGDHGGSKERADAGKMKEENKQGGMKRGQVTRNPQPKRADRLDKTQGQPTKSTESSQLKEEKQEPDSDVGGEQRQHRQTQGQQQPQMQVDKERQDGVENGQEWKEREAGSLEKDIAEGVVKRVRESDTAAGSGGQLTDTHSNNLTPHHHRHHHDQQQQQQGDDKTGEAEEESEKTQGGDERGDEEGGGELAATSLSHVISVGIGGVSTQETPSLPTYKRQRKVSTVNQPRLSADLFPDPAANTPTLLHHHHHHHHPTLTPIEAFSKGGKLLRGMGAPPASQVTCSVEVHREHGLTTPPVAVTSAMTRSLTEMTTTAAAEMRMSARSSPSAGPASAASPLTPDLDHVGESVV